MEPWSRRCRAAIVVSIEIRSGFITCLETFVSGRRTPGIQITMMRREMAAPAGFKRRTYELYVGGLIMTQALNYDQPPANPSIAPIAMPLPGCALSGRFCCKPLNQ